MQIHELTQSQKPRLDEVDWVGPDSVFNQAKSAWKTKGKSLWDPQADRDATQARYQDYAAKEIAQGQEKGYLKVPTLADSMAKLKSNPVAQQWINGVVAKWPAVAQTMPTVANPTIPVANPTIPASTVAEPITIGGKKLDPKNPNDARVITQLQAQGKLKEDTTTQTSNTTTLNNPGDSDYETEFRQWVDGQLRTTNLEQLEQSDSTVKEQLKELFDNIVKATGNISAQQKLVHDYFSVAVAANHILQAQQRISGKYSLANAAPRKPKPADQAQLEIGLTPIQLRTLGQAAVKAGGPVPTSTGNDFWNKLIQQALESVR